MAAFDIISGIIGLVLTLMVFSYLIGDNLLFRIAIYLFIGSASGYAASVVWYQLLFPRLQSLPLNDPLQLLLGVVPFFLGVMLWAKLLPRISWVGNFAMAVLVGVGAATAVGGALTGTLLPQTQAAMDIFSVRGFVMLIGTALTLIYFQFSAKRVSDGSVKRNAIIELLAWFGRIVIAVTFGVLFAGVYMSALTAMIERLSSNIDFVKSLLGL